MQYILFSILFQFWKCQWETWMTRRLSCLLFFFLIFKITAWFHRINLFVCVLTHSVALSWPSSLWYRNQSYDLQSKSIGWFLWKDLLHERVNWHFVLLGINIYFCLISGSILFIILEVSMWSVLLKKVIRVTHSHFLPSFTPKLTVA